MTVYVKVQQERSSSALNRSFMNGEEPNAHGGTKKDMRSANGVGAPGPLGKGSQK